MNEIFGFIDESGILQKGSDPLHRYFVISIVLTDDPKYLTKIFKRSRLKIVNKDERLKDLLKKNNEIKGSELTEKEKTPIYEEIIAKCKVEFGIIVVDTLDIEDNFKQNAARTFNYLLKLFFKSYKSSNNSFKDFEKIYLVIDERNVATKAVNTLEEYLNTELVLGEEFYECEFDVYYNNSKNVLLIQLSDYVANTALRSFRNAISEYDAADNIKMLIPFLTNNKFFTFNNSRK